MEEWKAEAEACAAWAQGARARADRYWSDRRWFFAIAVIATLLAFIGALYAAHSAFGRPVRWNQATASVYNVRTPLGCGESYRNYYGVAHRWLRCGTRVRFLYHGRKVTARVDDRGPFVGGREFDLGPGVQDALGVHDGLPRVNYRVLGR